MQSGGRLLHRLLLRHASRFPSTAREAFSFKHSTFKGGVRYPVRIQSMLNSTSSTVVPSLLSEMGEQVELLAAVSDDHGGVIVEMKNPLDPKAFASSLKASILSWKDQGIKGVWIKLPIGLANLVQTAVEEGFWYHHAEESYLMLVRWLPDTKHTLPINATHRVGIGGFVMNEKGEVLVVQEKSGRLRGSGVWKFPTGVVELGEDISAGAVREVKEETGVDAEFIEVLGFRQSHNAFFGKSDLFFICILRPLSFNIQRQESEIEAAQWMPIEEFAKQPFVERHELVKHIMEVGLAATNGTYAGFSPVSIKSAFSDNISSLYLNRKELRKVAEEDTEG